MIYSESSEVLMNIKKHSQTEPIAPEGEDFSNRLIIGLLVTIGNLYGKDLEKQIVHSLGCDAKWLYTPSFFHNWRFNQFFWQTIEQHIPAYNFEQLMDRFYQSQNNPFARLIAFTGSPQFLAKKICSIIRFDRTVEHSVNYYNLRHRTYYSVKSKFVDHLSVEHRLFSQELTKIGIKKSFKHFFRIYDLKIEEDRPPTNSTEAKLTVSWHNRPLPLVVFLLKTSKIGLLLFTLVALFTTNLQGYLLWLGGMSLGLLSLIKIFHYFSGQTSLREDKMIDYFLAELDQVEKQSRSVISSQMKIIQMQRLANTGKLSHSIMHEMAKPLTVIGNTLDILETTCRKQCPKGVLETLQPFIDQTNVSLKKVYEVSETLRVIYRKSNTQLELYYKQINVQELITGIKKQCAILYKGHSVKFTVQPSPDIVISTIPCLIEHSLLNLIHNAYQSFEGANNSKQEIRLHTLTEANSISFRVEDNGCGISHQHQENLFKNSFTTKELGVGLGLTLTRDFMKLLNGTVYLDMSEVGKGSTFVIRIPTEKEEMEEF